jgi:hypothetical protein
MTKRTLAAVLALTVIGAAATALAGTTSATTWDEALALSRQHDKPILIDFFTEW